LGKPPSGRSRVAQKRFRQVAARGQREAEQRGETEQRGEAEEPSEAEKPSESGQQE
jgi:hypothetical protein